MNISNFTTDDIVTRVQSARTGSFADSSYIGLKMQLVGYNTHFIVLVDLEMKQKIVLPQAMWAEGWDRYPQQLHDQADSLVASILNAKITKEEVQQWN